MTTVTIKLQKSSSYPPFDPPVTQSDIQENIDALQRTINRTRSFKNNDHVLLTSTRSILISIRNQLPE